MVTVTLTIATVTDSHNNNGNNKTDDLLLSVYLIVAKNPPAMSIWLPPAPLLGSSLRIK